MKMVKLAVPFALFMLMGSNAFAFKGFSVDSIQALTGVVNSAQEAQKQYQDIKGALQQPQSAPATNVKQPNQCPEHYPMGAPVVISLEKDKIERRSFYVCRTGYAVQFDPASKTPLWVSERLTSQQLAAGKEDRTDDFQPDPSIPAPAQATLNDYRGSKLDRGHMAPAADMNGRGGNAMSESFYLSNMIPQVGPNQNRGIWADLESDVRQWAGQRGEVLVVTGPIYEQGAVAMGKSQVWVPTRLYKVVLDPKTFESIAFIIPNRQIVTRKTRSLDEGNPQFPQTTPAQAVQCSPNPCTAQDFVVPVAAVEQLTGLRFFSRIAENDYKRVNQKVSGSWKMR